MSYQIYYDRAYIHIGDKFIPLVNSGSNNCFEYGYNGQSLCEKNWDVMNCQHKSQFLFTETEIKHLAQIYEETSQANGMCFKSRNRAFEDGEFGRWIINGMKNAYTIEEYVSFGNSFYVIDYSSNDTQQWKQYPFSTTDDLLRILDELSDADRKDIKIMNNREVHRPKTNRANGDPLRIQDLPEYYVLKGIMNGHDFYFISFNRKGGFKYTYYRTVGAVKLFKTERDAQRYLDKYKDRLQAKYSFTPEKIIRAAS